MANKEHLKILKQGVKNWNEWRKESPHVRPDLSNEILNRNRINLHRANLSNVNLRGTDLRGANLGDANLSYSDLSDADLSGANLRDADLRDALLTCANLSNSSLNDAYLCNVNLNCANLSGAELHRTYLGYADLSGIDLSGARLSHAYLKSANLCDANMRHASLIEANLSHAQLRDADLSRASLSYARLNSAILRNSNLSNADMSNSNLSDANLSDANLSDTDLSNAFLLRTILTRTNFHKAKTLFTTFADTDLSQAKELESIIHNGPSTIGIDTIYKSVENIPDVFLRGCGVPDNFISHTQTLIEQPIEFHNCYICYSEIDTSFAIRLYDQLLSTGVRCWLDEKPISITDDLIINIDKSIRMLDKVLLCVSEHSLNSWWIDQEIERIFEEERLIMKYHKKKLHLLLSINLDNNIFDWNLKSATRKAVKSRLAADFRGWETDNAKFEKQFELIVKAIRTGDGGR